MKKKVLLALAIAAFVVGSAYAQMSPMSFSVGGGAQVNFDYGGVSGRILGANFSLGYQNLGFGGWVFADAHFAELSIGLSGGPAWLVYDISFGGGGGGIPMGSGRMRYGTFLATDVSLLGKLPFSLGGDIAFFPLLGAGGQIMLSLRDMDGNSADSVARYFSNVRLMAGAGGDFGIGGALFVRTSILGYYRLATRDERDMVRTLPGINASGGFGGIARLGIGRRF